MIEWTEGFYVPIHDHVAKVSNIHKSQTSHNERVANDSLSKRITETCYVAVQSSYTWD